MIVIKVQIAGQYPNHTPKLSKIIIIMVNLIIHPTDPLNIPIFSHIVLRF
jgi:hypothetical protein